MKIEVTVTVTMLQEMDVTAEQVRNAVDLPEGDDPPTPADILAAAATAIRDVLGG